MGIPNINSQSKKIASRTSDRRPLSMSSDQFSPVRVNCSSCVKIKPLNNISYKDQKKYINLKMGTEPQTSISPPPKKVGARELNQFHLNEHKIESSNKLKQTLQFLKQVTQYKKGGGEITEEISDYQDHL